VTVAADVFDVVVDGRDAASVVAARDCARLGFRVALIDDPESWMFVPEQFVDFDDTIAELCAEFGVAYQVETSPVESLNVAGVPGNPLSPLVRERTGWAGAWRAYVDRVRPLLQIGTEDNLHRLVTRRLGATVRDAVVVPELTRLFGVHSADVSVNEVAHGLSEAMSRVGSLTAGVLELTAQEPRWTKSLTVTGGTQRLLSALDEAAEYFAVQRISRERSERVTATVWMLDIATTPEHPSWQRAIARARTEALQAKALLLSDPDNPPVGPIDLAE
jgi:oxygen-dependent protoporphyrinogen oxidase